MRRISLWLAVALAAVIVASVLTGCRTPVQPAEVPSNQMTPIVWNQQTADVLSKGLDVGGRVLASNLEANAETGSVFYINYDGWVYNPDGTLFLDQNGRPVRLRYEIVAKLNSLKELAEMDGIESVDYIVGGFGYVKDLPDDMKGRDLRPEGLRLHVKGAAGMKASDPTAANRAAAAQERAIILAGLAQLAQARGAAFAIRAEAVAGGLVKVTTAAGELVGKVIAAKPLTAAGIAGRVIEAVIQGQDGKQTTVVAQGDDATCLGDGCSVPVEWLTE